MKQPTEKKAHRTSAGLPQHPTAAHNPNFLRLSYPHRHQTSHLPSCGSSSALESKRRGGIQVRTLWLHRMQRCFALLDHQESACFLIGDGCTYSGNTRFLTKVFSKVVASIIMIVTRIFVFLRRARSGDKYASRMQGVWLSSHAQNSTPHYTDASPASFFWLLSLGVYGLPGTILQPAALSAR